ncbi:MAG: hypothetical protein LBT30_06165 [Clostridiales bacterium]|nr:hypothetical protein [Clostridiales bacterium]
MVSFKQTDTSPSGAANQFKSIWLWSLFGSANLLGVIMLLNRKKEEKKKI